jgi:segregation and condensation protein B
MNEFYIRNVVEAALLAAGKPLQLAELGQLFEETTRPKVDDIRAALDALAGEYSNRGVEVKETGAGFRIQVRREFSSEISRLWPERPARYSRALLETLALIAYRQPITRAEIEAVRGVAVNPNIVKTVIERNWVRVVGHRDVPGRPELLGTTREFLDYFGLRSLDELPPLAELKVLGDYNLQLELPNAGALGVEPKAEGDLEGAGEGQGADAAAVVVAGLLTGDAAGGQGGEVAADGTAEFNGVGADTADDASAVAGDAGAGVAHDGVSSVGAVGHEGDHDAVSSAGDVGADVAHDAISSAGDVGADVAHDAISSAGDVGADVAHDAVSSAGDVGADVAHDAVSSAEDVGHEVAHDAVSSAEDVGHEVAHDAVSSAEIDRAESVAAGARDEAVLNSAAESDDSESSDGTISSESLDADEAAEDDADDEELSADGHGSRELVAAPRDIDD